MSTQHQQSIHVAVGVIKTDEKHVLISKRPQHLHQGGLWEFPGGKVDAGETVQQALARELHEELDVNVRKCEPLIQIPYDYGDKHVLLDVFIVNEFTGMPHGKEDQEIRIIHIDELAQYDFPAANRGIVSALQLPHLYMITRESSHASELLTGVEQAIKNGIRLIQFRDHALDSEEYLTRLQQLDELCSASGAILIANTAMENFTRCDVAGFHLTSQRLMKCDQRPINRSKWLGASVHNEEELQHALVIGVDYVVLSPVKPTPSHPGVVPMGWENFHAITKQASVPVYALGGMTRDDLAIALQHGGQGIAGISLFS